MDEVKNTWRNFWPKLKSACQKTWHWLKQSFRLLKTTFLTGFTNWIDPKLEKYRAPAAKQHTPAQNINLTEVKNSPENHTPEPKAYTPETIDEFMALLKRTPRSVLDARERHVIATIMNFPNAKVSELMLPKTSITYVKEDEILGPLVLDRLYHSGFQHFPVVNNRHQIIGLVHTTALNSLEIKESTSVRDILDPKVYYLRDDYTLNQALAAFIRTNCYFFIVIDHYERIVGMLTYQMLMDYLLGETPVDKFDRDSDRLAVAKRK